MSDAESTTAADGRLETLRAAAPASVTVERTTAAEFGTALETAVERPAIGTPLPFEGLSLADAGIDALPVDDGRDGDRERGWLLTEAATGVTPAGLAIAERGTVTVRSRPAGDELVGLYPGRHVVVLRASDVVPDVRTAMARVGERVEAARAGERPAAGPGDAGAPTASEVLTTGPSATGDMGGLVEGVHGPREVHVLALEDR